MGFSTLAIIGSGPDLGAGLAWLTTRYRRGHHMSGSSPTWSPPWLLTTVVVVVVVVDEEHATGWVMGA